jgi:hypothetical protein
MRAELRGFYSSDIPDLPDYRPDDPECFQLQVTAFIGPAEGGGEEMFDFTVCTASWLQRHPPPKNFEFLRDRVARVQTIAPPKPISLPSASR